MNLKEDGWFSTDLKIFYDLLISIQNNCKAQTSLLLKRVFDVLDLRLIVDMTKSFDFIVL